MHHKQNKMNLRDWETSNTKWENKSTVQNALVTKWLLKGKQISENGFSKKLKLKMSQANGQEIRESS